MRKELRMVLVGSLLGFLLLVNIGLGVPVAPNDSIVTGVVLEYAILNSKLESIEPEQVLHTLRIEVLSSEDVPGMANFTRRVVGEVIKVYSKEWLSPYLFGKMIKANVQFVGDEWGGRYWIRNISIEKDD
jgi:hypothetical protein